MRTPFSCLNPLPKAPPPNSITLEIRFQHIHSGGHKRLVHGAFISPHPCTWAQTARTPPPTSSPGTSLSSQHNSAFKPQPRCRLLQKPSLLTCSPGFCTGFPRPRGFPSSTILIEPYGLSWFISLLCSPAFTVLRREYISENIRRIKRIVTTRVI